MELFQYVLASTYNLFCIDFTLYGYTFSFGDVFVWGCVAATAIGFLKQIWKAEDEF